VRDSTLNDDTRSDALRSVSHWCHIDTGTTTVASDSTHTIIPGLSASTERSSHRRTPTSLHVIHWRRLVNRGLAVQVRSSALTFAGQPVEFQGFRALQVVSRQSTLNASKT